MRKTILAAATALSLAAMPVVAQDAANRDPGAQAVYEALSPEQQAMFDRLTPDRQVMYFGWTDALRDYYWTLGQQRQDAWWYLSDEQRIALFRIQDSQQREEMWSSIVEQVAALDQPDTSRDVPTPASGSSATTTEGTEVTFVSNSVVQDAPPPHQGEYPVCTDGRTDNCINAWEAGQRGPGVTRPLDHWPGEPASS